MKYNSFWTEDEIKSVNSLHTKLGAKLKELDYPDEITNTFFSFELCLKQLGLFNNKEK